MILSCTFTANTAENWGGAVSSWGNYNHIINCNFVNSKWSNSTGKFNGIHAMNNLDINGGNGIVDILPSKNLSGISIVVLNNETQEHPPNTNINFWEDFFISFVVVCFLFFAYFVLFTAKKIIAAN